MTSSSILGHSLQCSWVVWYSCAIVSCWILQAENLKFTTKKFIPYQRSCYSYINCRVYYVPWRYRSKYPGRYANIKITTLGITPNIQLHIILISIAQHRHEPESCISRSSKTPLCPTVCIKHSDSKELLLAPSVEPHIQSPNSWLLSSRLWPLPNCPQKWSTRTVQGLLMIPGVGELCFLNLVWFAM